MKMTVSNKAEDYAYTSKILLKHPENLNFIGPDQVFDYCKAMGSLYVPWRLPIYPSPKPTFFPK